MSLNKMPNSEVLDGNTEHSILLAAEELFLQKGFAMTSTTEIAEKAGCNQALIHYYYRTKENLFHTIFTQKVQAFVAVFFEIDRSESDFFTRLRRKIETHFDFMATNPRLPFLLINEVTTNPSRIHQMRESLDSIPMEAYDRLDRDVQEAIRLGLIRRISVADLMLNIISLNAMSFLAEPILLNILDMNIEAYQAMVLSRKAEIVETIVRSLKP